MRPAGALLVLAVVARAASVSGSVCLRDGHGCRPLGGVRVMARRAGGETLLQAAASGSDGRYLLEGLPSGRISLTAARLGYFSVAVQSGEPALALDLAASAEVSGANFEVQRGGAVSGRITGRFGEALPNAEIRLYQVSSSGARRYTPAGSARTDDRGVYRAFGLAPGRYVLLVQLPPSAGDDPTAAYYPGTIDAARAGEIEIAAGGEASKIDVVMRPELLLRLQGRIVGATEDWRSVYVRVTPAGNEPGNDRELHVSVEGEGRFTIQGLLTGSYVVSAESRPQSGTSRTLARRLVDLRPGAANLELPISQPGRLEGRVVFPGSASRRPPPELRIRMTHRNQLQTAEVAAQAPDYRFAAADLWPGPYTFQVVAPANFYWKKAAPEATVPEGGAATVELEPAMGLGLVSGKVKAPGGSGQIQPHARVALARAGTPPAEVRTVQTDQQGGFSIPDVLPGEYLLGAWPRLDANAPYAPEFWNRAGKGVKRFTVEPGAEVEIDLTATP